MDAEEIKINIQKAETVYISTKETSYGIFCFNSIGDLFLNSDWGFYCFAWRAYGDDFKGFLKSLNVDYVLDKFEYNLNSEARRHFKGKRKESVAKLISLFIKTLKAQQA